MPSESLSTAIPLFQASLVALTVWLGVARWILDRDEEPTTAELGLVTAGTTLLWWMLMSFSAAIMRNSSSNAIITGLAAANALILLITAAVIALMRAQSQDSGWRDFAVQGLIAISVVAATVVIEVVMRATVGG
ncbi:hypothetical protein [Halobacterium litoreum]|uniref:Uncharacterized protein n=1 Tax=Halobacterium litoreum TaxID=2039234 RepID=A0ABD5NHL2_9EURY|nr:hypothetical protein [Halobacterium litoreum]UHH12415.1 hypothetical protein LT972_09620 [Halobacterium litoreum]